MGTRLPRSRQEKRTSQKNPQLSIFLHFCGVLCGPVSCGNLARVVNLLKDIVARGELFLFVIVISSQLGNSLFRIIKPILCFKRIPGQAAANLSLAGNNRVKIEKKIVKNKNQKNTC